MVSGPLRPFVSWHYAPLLFGAMPLCCLVPCPFAVWCHAPLFCGTMPYNLSKPVFLIVCVQVWRRLSRTCRGRTHLWTGRNPCWIVNLIVVTRASSRCSANCDPSQCRNISSPATFCHHISFLMLHFTCIAVGVVFKYVLYHVLSFVFLIHVVLLSDFFLP